MAVRWVLQDAVGNLDALHAAVFRRGETWVDITDPRRPEADPVLEGDEPVVALVSTQLARRLRATRPWVPGVFWHPETYAQHHWSAHFGAWMLNADQVFLPWAEVLRRRAHWARTWPGPGIFIRPSSGQKLFTGQVLRFGAWDDEVRAFTATYRVDPEVLVGVSAAKELGPFEWRFWIANRQVVAESAYSWTHAETPPAPAACCHLAHTLAQHPWQPDRAWVLDLTLHDGQARVVEINAASCSGLYAADLDALLAGLAQAAQQEHDDM